MAFNADPTSSCLTLRFQPTGSSPMHNTVLTSYRPEMWNQPAQAAQCDSNWFRSRNIDLNIFFLIYILHVLIYLLLVEVVVDIIHKSFCLGCPMNNQMKRIGVCTCVTNN